MTFQMHSEERFTNRQRKKAREAELPGKTQNVRGEILNETHTENIYCYLKVEFHWSPVFLLAKSANI